MQPRKTDNGVRAGVLTAIAMLAGGVESSVAAEMMGFDVSVESQQNVSSTGDFPFGPVSESQTLNFMQFNPSLGELTDVLVTFSDNMGESSAQAAGSAPSSGAVFSITNTSSFSVDIAGVVMDEPFGPLESMGQCSAAPGETAPCSDTGTTSVPGADFMYDITTNLDPFIGTNTFPIVPMVEINGSFVVTGDPLDQSINGAGTARGSWKGVASVTFEFTPTVVVAEPGALVLLGTGLAGLGFARSRRRKR